MPRARTIFQTSLAAFLLVIILIALHWLGWLRPIESGLAFVFEPVARGMRVVSMRVGNSFQLLTNIGNLAEDNKELAAQVEVLQGENARLKEYEAEVEDLRKRLDAPLDTNIETTRAGVIGHDGISATKRLVINKGERDGISKDQAVLSANGSFIGSVSEVLDGQAEILLITDDSSVVPARLSESRASGLIKGELGLGLKMTDIPQQDNINEADLVVTSGLGGNFPGGLGIGLVETVEDAANALFQVARVQPLVNVGSLEFVYVVTSF